MTEKRTLNPTDTIILRIQTEDDKDEENVHRCDDEAQHGKGSTTDCVGEEAKVVSLGFCDSRGDKRALGRRKGEA